MLDQEDEGTRIGVWVALGVVFFVLVGVIGGLVLRQLHAKVPAAPTVAAADGLSFIDAPLEGELVATVYFALGKSSLPEDARAALEKTKVAADAAPARRIVLSGFHDASGSAAVNAEIAKQRAKTIREALSAEGISAARIALRKPDVTLGDGAAPEARRVEIRLVD
jgi:outer membrane protein OmpA-like peptidoglycan-associated protein